MISRLDAYLYHLLTKKAQPDRSMPSSAVKAAGYYSQCGQDKLINENLVRNMKNGVFLDIGANDGVTISNTYYFERRLDWTGIAVEPVPEAFEKLVANRKCIAINGCVADYNGTVSFLALEGYTEMLSGIAANYDKRHLQRIESELLIYGGQKRPLRVPCFTPESIFEKHALARIDYLSIDVEGSELQILKSIDFGKREIGILSVENNYHNWRIPAYLNRKGFQLAAIVGDEIYVRRPHSVGV